MSPGSGSENQYGGLVTSTRSPVQPVQPCRVCSIDPDGMKNACTRKVLTSSASTKAISSSTGSSRSSEPFFFGSSRRRRRSRREEVFPAAGSGVSPRSEEHTSEIQSRPNLGWRLLLEKKKKNKDTMITRLI